MSVNWSYFNKFEPLEDIYLPSSGQGNTKATQLVTAVAKIVYKYFNDGDTYDNTNIYWYEGMNDLSSYANWIHNNYSFLGNMLERIWEPGFSESDYQDLLKDLCNAVFRETWLEKENDKPAVGDIYEAEGPFSIEEPEDEEDDYWEEDEEEDWDEDY